MAGKRWVYEANDGAECSVKIKKSSKQDVVFDDRGDIKETVQLKAIYLRFIKPANGGPARAVIDDFLAEHYGYPVEVLVELVNIAIRQGANIRLVQGPGKDEDIKIEATKTEAAAGPKVKHGVRGRSA